MYRIKTVSELTGIPKNTLVAWERRYGVPEPERKDNGYRFYSEADVALVLQLKHALGEGLKISEAVERVKRRLAAGPAPSAREPALSDATAFAELRAELLAALVAFDRERAERLVERLMQVPYAAAIDEVYFPLLRAVGDGWASGEVSVTQEHFAAAFVRDQLVAMLLRVGCGPATGRRVACVTFPGDAHELGVLGLSVRLALAGWRVTYLGANLPLEELCRFAQAFAPARICVSVLTPVRGTELSAYARRLRAAAPPATELVIGGAGLPGKAPEVAGVRVVPDWHALVGS
ncbi:MAG: MerR family transcriptional regulator [Polyangiaceae bacterium]|nr:MerR family transcriptional regulator [Polyangiaceae bacterium]